VVFCVILYDHLWSILIQILDLDYSLIILTLTWAFGTLYTKKNGDFNPLLVWIANVSIKLLSFLWFNMLLEQQLNSWNTGSFLVVNSVIWLCLISINFIAFILMHCKTFLLKLVQSICINPLLSILTVLIIWRKSKRCHYSGWNGTLFNCIYQLFAAKRKKRNKPVTCPFVQAKTIVKPFSISWVNFL
jgi:hypothetical protein